MTELEAKRARYGGMRKCLPIQVGDEFEVVGHALYWCHGGERGAMLTPERRERFTVTGLTQYTVETTVGDMDRMFLESNHGFCIGAVYGRTLGGGVTIRWINPEGGK